MPAAGTLEVDVVLKKIHLPPSSKRRAPGQGTFTHILAIFSEFTMD